MEKILKRKKIFINSCILAGIFVSILLLLGIVHIAFFVMGIVIFIIGLFLALAYYHFKITLPYKNEVVGPVLKELSPTLEYKYKDPNINYKDLIKKNSLIPPSTAFAYNDIIYDQIDGLPYISMDFTASHTQSTGKSAHTVIDFKGKLYDITLGKTYCNYILKEENWKRTPKGYQLIDLEVIAFNHKFDLYTTDAIEIFKIFTPKRIEILRNMEFFKDKKSMICYIDSHLYIFLSNKENQFEGMVSKKQIIDEYQSQLNNLKKYLDIFRE